MEITRRSFIKGIIAACIAPAIVRFESIMPINSGIKTVSATEFNPYIFSDHVYDAYRYQVNSPWAKQMFEKLMRKDPNIVTGIVDPRGIVTSGLISREDLYKKWERYCIDSHITTAYKKKYGKG